MNRRVISKQEEDSPVARFESLFAFPKKPSVIIPELPQYLDDMNDDEFMNLYSEFIAWTSYTKAELAKAEIEEERHAHACRLVEAEVLVEQWSADAKGDRVTIARARRDSDKRVVAQQERHLNARAYRKLMEAVFERCERSAQLLSRELTRRTSTSPRETRSSKYIT